MRSLLRAPKKNAKKAKKGLTKGGRSGNISGLSDERTCGRAETEKSLKEKKKVLDKLCNL